MPALPADERKGDAARWHQAGQELGEFAAKLADKGIKLGYHNHHWELEAMADGRPALAHFFDGANGHPLTWQVDVAWLARGGANPSEWLVKEKARVASAHGLLTDTVIVSDDAGQFDVGRHGLCWVHAERLVHKLDTFTDRHHAAQQRVRSLIWWFYADLKAYRRDPTPARRAALRTRFDRIFKRRTGFATLDRLLARLHANKAELLMVLDRPDIPLHTNGSENDIRCQVTRRKLSGGTRSDAGRDCRDAFLGIAKTCAKLRISFWDYLGSRLAVAGNAAVPYLPELVGNPA